MKVFYCIALVVSCCSLASAAVSPSTIGWNQDNAVYKPTEQHEGKIEAFLGDPEFSIQPLFAGDRFPNVAVALDGSVLAVFGSVSLRRSADGGVTWGDLAPIAKGFMGGGVTVDEISGDVLAFVESKHPPAPLVIMRSKDHGVSWQKQDATIYPNSMGHMPSMHMNECGISLRHGPFKGRLIRPTRWYGRSNYPQEFFHTHYTNAMFSDDGGLSWQASDPVPVMGTGEACIVELSDGSLYYNTRRHWAPTREDSLWRWSCVSHDGGATWKNPQRSAVLPDGNTDSTYGLMSGLTRLPVLDRDILVFSNIVSGKGRVNGHVWASFDGGKSWPLRRQVYSGKFAYSSLSSGRPGTASEGWIYLLFEGGPEGAGTMARFNLSWLLDGEPTGDGKVPDWLK